MAGKEVAEKGLTQLERAFAWHVVCNRALRGDPKAAAIAAGYAEADANSNSLKLLARPHVQKQIRTNQRKSLAELATESLHSARELLSSPDTPASAKITLIKAIWSHSGLEQPQVLDKEGDRPLNSRDKAELKAFVREGLSKMAETAKEARGSQVIDTQGEG